jgi:hypothetical protein
VTTRSNHNATITLWVATWIVAAVCVWNSTPGLGWLDAGDFATAGFSLGVPHPTGFPLLTQLTNLAGLLPAGSLGGRSAWLSGAATAAAIGLLVAALFRERASKALGFVVAVAALHGIATLSIHARTTEVYGLSLLLGAALVWTLAQADARRDAPDLRLSLLLGLLLGLGFAHHAIFRLWAPAIVLLHLRQLPKPQRNRALCLGTLGAVVGGLTNLYLVAAALRGGAHNWGDPSTLPALMRVLQGAEIREAFSGEMGSIAHLPEHLLEAVRQLGGGLPIIAAGLMLFFGMMRWRRGSERAPAALVAAGWMIALEVLYSLFLNPMGLRDLQNLQWTALLLPLLGIASLERAAGPVPAKRWLLPAAAVALALLFRTPSDARAVGLADDWSSEDLGAVALAAAPPEAVVLPASDSLIASTLFLQVAGDARPDLYLIGRSQASREDSLRYLDARQPFSLLGEPPESGDVADLRPRFGRLLTRATEAGHAVFWERLTRDTDLPAATVLTDCWPLAIVGSAGSCPADRRVGSGRLDVAFGEAARASSGAALPPYQSWLAELQGARGSDQARAGDWGSALPSFAAAATLAPSSSRLSNLAVALANLGRSDEAFAALEAAWPLYPQSTKLCGNAAAFPTTNPEVGALWAKRCPAHPSE